LPPHVSFMGSNRKPTKTLLKIHANI
jgi:hypothetical protein